MKSKCVITYDKCYEETKAVARGQNYISGYNGGKETFSSKKRLQVKFKDDCEKLGQEVYRRVGLTVL